MARSPLAGRRIHIAGSIVDDVSLATGGEVTRARDFVKALTLEMLSKGANFVIPVDAEKTRNTVGPLVRDKDGISAALLFAELWAARRAAGKTLFEELETIARRYGLFASSQLSVTMKGQDGLSQIRAVMARLRATRLEQVGPLAEESTSDVAAGTRVDRAGATSRLALPASDVLMYALAGGSRIIARPSGTEPKIKIYFDVREPMSEGEPLAEVEARAGRVLEALKKAFAAIAGL